MLAPRFARVTLALDTDRFRMMREGERKGALYLLDRLLSGEAVADIEMERLGIKVRIEPAVSAEIIKR